MRTQRPARIQLASQRDPLLTEMNLQQAEINMKGPGWKEQSVRAHDEGPEGFPTQGVEIVHLVTDSDIIHTRVRHSCFYNTAQYKPVSAGDSVLGSQNRMPLFVN